ncbi:MAG: glycosyltransferase family 4 protein [Austwickia sp.]|nr:glycosyltransferase family 4 protein [Austwickia sp.]MBK8436811.1 glycosyltransferase family 4 protein [Austwickia sp.]
MLVATSVATDTRVLREATTLASAGHAVHIIGRSVPADWTPPVVTAGALTVSTVGTSSVFRAEGAPSLSGRRLPPHLRLARWALLPRHRASAFGRWCVGAVADGRTRAYDVVHCHDFNALPAGVELARAGSAGPVPLVYDSHEFWSGRPREYRPTPLADRRERALEARLGAGARAVITVGDGVAAALRAAYGWDHITVVRNTFPYVEPARLGADAERPAGLVYAGRLAAYRELEVIAAASHRLEAELGLPVTLMGPGDDTWLARFDPGRARIAPPAPADDVDAVLRSAGLVLVTHSDRWENHRLALPNKLFHAVRAGVPVVATDVGELAKMVRAHGIGTLYPPGDAAGLVDAVTRAVADYPALCQAVRAAAPDLSWEADAARLLQVYDELSRDPRPVGSPQ